MRVVVLPDEPLLLGEAGYDVVVATLLGGVELAAALLAALLAVVLVTVLVLVLVLFEPAVGPKGMHVASMGN